MEIVKDISYGFIDSIRMDIFASYAYSNTKGLRTIFKILKYNLYLHVVPTFIANLLSTIFQFSFYTILYYLNYLLMTISIFLHTVAYIELANSLSGSLSSKKFKKVKSEISFSNTITIIIMMTIYQLVVFFSTKLISLVLDHSFYLLGIIINFIILTIYHSIYAYNNLWQGLGIDLNKRIIIHEKRWAYFLGYGLTATILYTYAVNGYIVAIYNMYVGALLSIPLLLNFDYDFYFGSNIPYFRLNLSFFSVLIMWIFTLVKKILYIG
jgi:hypothetical protein